VLTLPSLFAKARSASDIETKISTQGLSREVIQRRQNWNNMSYVRASTACHRLSF